jgi:hypothetical protein
MVILASFAPANLSPVPNDLFAVTTPVYRIAFYIALMFMTINENVLSRSIPMRAGWWESLLNVFTVTALLIVLVYYLPFQVSFLFLTKASTW